MEKYGFIYLWFDKKYNKFYLGRHWGTEEDGYICSSPKMREARYRRPNDFKRRVLIRLYDKEQLVEEEQRWLNMIKPIECKTKYYNVSLNAKTPTMRGRKHSAETIEKIRNGNQGKVVSEATKQKIRDANAIQFADLRQRQSRSEKITALWNNPEYRRKQTLNKIGCVQSQETKDKRAAKLREHWKNNVKLPTR